MSLNHHKITVVGAGLAGSECAYQLAERGYDVVLYEMRPVASSAAHKTNDFAELVCSNSFGSLGDLSPTGQLKKEATALNSFILKTAMNHKIPAGQALGIDREAFARSVTERIKAHPRIQIKYEVVENLKSIPRPAVIATGPLTGESLATDLREHFGDEFLYFFDAIAPIVDADTINSEIAWKADRYDKGTGDYWNCPLEKDQYYQFIEAVLNSRKIEPKHFETTNYFEGCMPIEVMAERGPETLRFGPMKPVGLRNPRTGRDAYAIVQLRQDNKEATAFNMVGFQTRMAYPEQTRVFRMIPGLENAEFLKLGSMHRNLYVNSPKRLNSDLSSKSDPWLFFAGQITGVEGYFESTCTGLLVAEFLDQKLNDKEFSRPPRASAFGSLLESITDPSRADHFQPTNINFGLFPQLTEAENELHFPIVKRGRRFIQKDLKKKLQIEKANSEFLNWANEIQKTSRPAEFSI